MIAYDHLPQIGAIDPYAMGRIAAALRAETRDRPALLDRLATKMTEALPAQTHVRCERMGMLRKPARVTCLVVVLGACQYMLSEETDGRISATCAMVSGDTLIATDYFELDAWLDLLARDLAAYAHSSAVARRALSRLVI